MTPILASFPVVASTAVIAMIVKTDTDGIFIMRIVFVDLDLVEDLLVLVVVVVIVVIVAVVSPAPVVLW